MTENEKILETRNLKKVYTTGKIQVTAVDNISLSISKGSFIGISGASGSGKSTLINLLGGLDSPTSGDISVKGSIISQMNKDELALYRRKVVGMIFQTFNLLASLNAVENVTLPLLFADVPKKKRRERAEGLLDTVGLSHRLIHRPAELSGGEQQRVAIARALVNQPEILLADEPTGNLDSGTSRAITELLYNLCKEHYLTVIMVSHESALLKEFADRIIFLQDGRLDNVEEIR